MNIISREKLLAFLKEHDLHIFAVFHIFRLTHNCLLLLSNKYIASLPIPFHNKIGKKLFPLQTFQDSSFTVVFFPLPLQAILQHRQASIVIHYRSPLSVCPTRSVCLFSTQASPSSFRLKYSRFDLFGEEGLNA